MEDLGRHAETFEAGTVLFRQGEKGGHMYVIQSGQVEISRHVGEREAVLAVLPAGEFFGEMSIINNAPRSATARVVERSQLLVIGASTFESMIRDSSEIAVRMMKRLAHRLDQAGRQIELLMFRDPNSRVVHCLRQLAEEGGTLAPAGLAVEISNEDLAERLGLSLEEVTTVLKRLERARLVRRHGPSSLAVAEVGKLQDFLDFVEMRERYGT